MKRVLINTNMQKLFSLVSCFVISFQLSAQYQISGRIVDEGKNEPLELANIVLNTGDSLYITGTASDTKGLFHLKGITAGDYSISVSFLGYSTKVIVLDKLSASIDLGDIFLKEDENMLGEVTVSASNITNKADRMVIFVTERQKSGSTNGINLLNTMQLPRLTVNAMTNEITVAGSGNVQLCINGVMVNSSDVRALQPGSIIRVEYLDNPGVRYGNADVVINYILKREVTGGTVSLDLQNAVTTWFANDQISAKVNHKKSEFGLNYSLRYRDMDKIRTEEERTFNFPDNSRLIRFSDGFEGNVKENEHNLALNYNLLDNKYYFNATVRHSIINKDSKRLLSDYTNLNPSEVTDVYRGSVSHQQLPSVDLYYFRSLNNKQSVAFNVVGTNINSDISQDYYESKGGLTIADIISDVDGNKYSVIAEGIYEKIFENANRFTAGMKHTQAFADNEYTGTENSLTEMKQADTYLFTEYAGKKGKFNYIAGIGVSRSWASQEGESNYSFYTFRPKLTLQYDFKNSMFLRIKGEMNNSSPSLSNLSAVDQHIDTLQIMRGNPGLKPNLNYLTELLYNWRKGIYGIYYNVSYRYSPNPIMAEIITENNMFIHTYDNQKNWQKFNSELTFTAGPIKNFIMFSLTGGINHFASNGNTYSHKYTNLYYRASVMAEYKKMSGVFQINNANDNFYGETLNGGESMHLFMLSYRINKCNLGLGVMQPFSTYKRRDENKNILTSSDMTSYAGNLSGMVMLRFAWNCEFGRKIKGGSKRFNNKDTDSGIMQTN